MVAALFVLVGVLFVLLAGMFLIVGTVWNEVTRLKTRLEAMDSAVTHVANELVKTKEGVRLLAKSQVDNVENVQSSLRAIQSIVDHATKTRPGVH